MLNVFDKIQPGYRSLARGPGENIFVHLAAGSNRFPPVVGPRLPMPWVVWQAFHPGVRTPFATGRALSIEGAKRKAWRAFDALPHGRERWRLPTAVWDSDDLRQDFRGGSL